MNRSVFALALWIAAAAWAGEAVPLAQDAALESRVAGLSQELRCLVCQNQTLADSHAPLAIDLKNQVREMMVAGKSDAEVASYMVERYGDFILYRPPLKATTLLLWLAPLLLAAGSIVFLVRRIRALGREMPLPIPDALMAERADALLGMRDGKRPS